MSSYVYYGPPTEFPVTDTERIIYWGAGAGVIQIGDDFVQQAELQKNGHATVPAGAEVVVTEAWIILQT